MYAILHEWKSIDKGFFELLLDSLDLDKSEISFLGMGSKSNFFKTRCIKKFLNCSEFKSKSHDKSIFNIIYKNAYPNVPYNFEHPNFNKLKEKLKNLFKEII